MGNSSALATREDTQAAVIEQVVINNDLSKLSPQERVAYYYARCASAGLDPRTQPYQYITLQGKLTLYATKAATDQLRKNHGISLRIVSQATVGDMYITTVEATAPDGRTDSDMGAVNIAGKRGDDLVNAMLKSITKAKRRVTLSICGQGMLDESEIETISGAQRTRVSVASDLAELGAGAAQQDVSDRVVEWMGLDPESEEPVPAEDGNELFGDYIAGVQEVTTRKELNARHTAMLKAIKEGLVELNPLEHSMVNEAYQKRYAELGK